MIRLGTLFSGIGAIEQALSIMKIRHTIVFACDNGELELKLLPIEEQKEFESLKKIPRYKISRDESNRLSILVKKERERIDEEARYIEQLPSILEKKEYVDELYRQHSNGDNLVKQTYLANYEINESDFHLDVHFFDGRDYANIVDLMVGGSPCQAFSSNGKRGGLADTRGTLFYEYARIISEVHPKAFIFENVKSLLAHDGGNTWAVIKNTFRELKYTIYIRKDEKGKETAVLNALEYGIPQQRERIFLIGIRNDINLKQDFHFPIPMKLEKTNKDFLDENVPAKYYLGKKGFEFVTSSPTRAQVGRSIQKCQKANQQFNWNGDFIFEPLSQKHTPEILQRAYVGNWNGQKGVIRQYTPRIVVSKAQALKQSGNSIVVNVLIELVKELIKTGVFDE